MAPWARVFSTFTSGVPVRHDDGRGDAEALGVIGDRLGVVAGRHGDDAAPALLRRRGSSSLLTAPRSLKEPVGCMFSCFTKTVAPVSSDSRGAGTSGVRRTWPSMIVAAARRTSSMAMA